jgi:hypothetical protein
MLDNVMLDLETWGTKPGSAIRSIGMVMFHPRVASFGAEFYQNVDLESQLAIGATQDESTIKWWNQQGEEAQAALIPNQVSIQEAINKMRSFIKINKGKQVWGQGANFDVVLIEALIDKIGGKVPWRFYNARDTRTAYEMAEFDTKSVKRQGTYHNALDDAKHQVRCVFGSYRKIYGA